MLNFFRHFEQSEKSTGMRLSEFRWILRCAQNDN